MRKAYALAALALIASPGAAKRPSCPPERADTLVALIRATDGDMALIVARIPRRLSTEDVECWAATGDKRMMIELGKRLEVGTGIDQDVERAEQLFEHAADLVSGNLAIYVPGFGGKPGYVMFHRIRPDVPGLPEGDYRRALMHIEGRAAKPKPKKGFKLLDRLAKDGYPPAIERLAALVRT